MVKLRVKSTDIALKMFQTQIVARIRYFAVAGYSGDGIYNRFNGYFLKSFSFLFNLNWSPIKHFDRLAQSCKMLKSCIFQ